MIHYVELTISYDDVTGVLEASSRQKKDGGDWSTPSDLLDYAPLARIAFDWIQLEMELGL